MLSDKELAAALEGLKTGEKRKFSQTYDLIVSLKDLNLKNPEEQVEFFAQLPKGLGKKRKVCALVGPEMSDDAKGIFDTIVTLPEFEKLNKQQMKKIAASHEYFIGQATIMPKIAQAWGRILGPRSRMPNPKAGGIVPPKAPLAPLYERLQQTIRISARKSPNIQVPVGTDAMATADIVENIKSAYDQIIHHLPREKNNVKQVLVKLTMSKPVKIQ